ncbi:transposase [Streptomyces mutabilis]|uniref:transposase n=1 Tax=Streptomyces mutabilis TaxID=67332 RepID=UPI00364C14DD
MGLAAWSEAARLGPAAPAAAERFAVEEPAGLGRGGDRLLARAGHPQSPNSGPGPVDRARPGSRRHLIGDGQGIPLAVTLTGGNRNDVTQLLPLLDSIPSLSGRAGRPRRRPDALPAVHGYDHDMYRRRLWQRWIRRVIAKEASPVAPVWAPSATSSSAPSPGSTACPACGSASAPIT